MRKHSPDNPKSVWKYLAIVAVVLPAVILLTSQFIHYVASSVHNERDLTLSAQVNTTSGLINGTISRYSEYLDICANVVSAKLQSGENIHDFMDNFGSELYLEGARLILVDKSCIWYSENHSQGRITSISSYAKTTPDKLVYITRGVDVDIESFVFRVRLEEPIDVLTDNGSSTICFAAVVFYLDALEEQITPAFPFECNQFIINEAGMILYKDFDYGMLIRGTNIFAKYSQVDFLYDDNGNDLLNSIRDGNTTVGEFTLNNENFFICVAPLNVNNWKVGFVLKADELETGYIRNLTLYVGGFCLALIFFIILAMMFLFQIKKSQQQLETEQLANRYLEKASRAKGEFLSNMSHDIRTPINGIVGMTLLAQKEQNPPKTEECLRVISGVTDHLLSLVNDVLDMSSIESGKLTIASKPINLEVICRACEEMINAQIGNRKLEFVTDFAAFRSKRYLSDELRIRQILLNILSNAVKHTNDGGRISFSVREEAANEETSLITFEIADTGIGMKPEFLEHIWEPFTQEESGSRTQFKGTGLGMTITKNYVDLMGGTITVTSVYEKGSTFTVQLPLPLVAFEETDSDTATSAEIQGTKILIVEDNDINRMLICELLSDEGVVITEAKNGKEAVTLFTENPAHTFDMILMDIKMPVMDGMEATVAIRASNHPQAKTIPIIALTANSFEEDVNATANAGMNAHLHKPIELTEIRRAISKYRYTAAQKQDGKDG